VIGRCRIDLKLIRSGHRDLVLPRGRLPSWGTLMRGWNAECPSEWRYGDRRSFAGDYRRAEQLVLHPRHHPLWHAGAPAAKPSFSCADLEAAGIWDTRDCCEECHEQKPCTMVLKPGLEGEVCCAVSATVTRSIPARLRALRQPFFKFITGWPFSPPNTCSEPLCLTASSKASRRTAFRGMRRPWPLLVCSTASASMPSASWCSPSSTRSPWR